MKPDSCLRYFEANCGELCLLTAKAIVSSAGVTVGAVGFPVTKIVHIRLSALQQKLFYKTTHRKFSLVE